MTDFEIEWVAVIVATAAAMAIGFAWFSLLAEPWMRAVGTTREEIGEGPRPSVYAVTTLLQLVTAVALAIVVDWGGADTFAEGILVGFLAWAGFVATRKGISSLFERRARNLFAIDAGHDLVVLLVMGVVLALWN